MAFYVHKHTGTFLASSSWIRSDSDQHYSVHQGGTGHFGRNQRKGALTVQKLKGLIKRAVEDKELPI
jgi:hypothetical protein